MQKFVRSGTDPLEYTPNGVNLSPPTPEILRLQKLQRTFYVQFLCATLYCVAMLLYVPVGLAVVQDFKRLSVQEVRASVRCGAFAVVLCSHLTRVAWHLQCLDRDLGDAYCRISVRYDENDTELWNYGRFAL